MHGRGDLRAPQFAGRLSAEAADTRQSAIAARTNQLMMTLIVILPFYDPVRLAEEIAVLDLISKGRAAYVFGLAIGPRNTSISDSR
jgi:alkanesulfonate monooxygenase SsuD/methylene tetrahydromethanopterin reductase-like flavin-dependent oxidoreductase (luciferase family)